MKTLPKAAGTLALLVCAALASGSTLAQPHGRRFDHGRDHDHRGSVRFGISVGVPLYAPGYYLPPYYAYPAYPYAAPVYAYPPLVLGSSSPPVYVERGAAPPAQAQAQAQGDWYYCATSKSYYPYVAECAVDWQRVPAQPPAR